MTSQSGPTRTANVLSKISTHGRWVVRIMPVDTKRRLLSPLACRTAVERSAVEMRGWDYPHVVPTSHDDHGAYPIEHGYETWTDWDTHIEAWRFMQSGQFVHQFAMWEEFELPRHVERNSGHPWLSLESTIYSFTEILTFAARLTEQVDYGDKITIEVGLRETGGRQLFADFRRALFRRYACEIPAIHRTLTVAPDELRANRLEFSNAMSRETLALFSLDIEARIVSDIQEQLASRRWS